MKRTIAIVIAILIMVSLLPVAAAAGNSDKPKVNGNSAKPTATVEQRGNKPTDADKAAKKAFLAQLKVKKATMQTNHHELMKLRIQVRTMLAQVNETLTKALASDTITPELTALLPQAQTDMKNILDALKATGNNGAIRKQLNACLKYAKQKNYTQALASIDQLIAAQQQQKATLEQLVAQVQTLLANIVTAANAPQATVPPTPPAPPETSPATVPGV